MIIAQAPLRIPIAGGGTDIPEFFSKYGSYFISAAINKYVYVVVNNRFEKEIRVSYKENEYVGSIDDIKHPIVKECLKHFEISDHCEIITFAELPGTSGMGSSGSFTVALVAALNRFKNNIVENVPEFAYHIERDVLQRPIGKQDQYIAWEGGLTQFFIDRDGSVSYNKFKNSDILRNLALYFTGMTRDSSSMLRHLPTSENQLIDIQALAPLARTAINKNDIKSLGEIFDTHWTIKKSIASEMSHSFIDSCYKTAMENGALGGKIIGAGGGGFLAFVFETEEDHAKLSKAMYNKGLEEVNFDVVKYGVRVDSH